MQTILNAVRTRLRWTLAALAGLAAMAAWTIAGGATSAAPGSPTLKPGADPPDLAEQGPSNLEVMRISAGPKTYYRMAVKAVPENIGHNTNRELYIGRHRTE